MPVSAIASRRDGSRGRSLQNIASGAPAASSYVIRRRACRFVASWDSTTSTCFTCTPGWRSTRARVSHAATHELSDLAVPSGHASRHLEERIFVEQGHETIERAVVVVPHIALEELADRELVVPLSGWHGSSLHRGCLKAWR